MIKKALILLTTLLVFSCSLDTDASAATYQELLAVETAEMPETFEIGVSYKVNLTYLIPTNCHSFNGIYYVKNNNERTVAIISNAFQGENCNAFDALSTPIYKTSFDFLPTELGDYVFKFWQGLNEEGEDEYLIMEIPVLE